MNKKNIIQETNYFMQTNPVLGFQKAELKLYALQGRQVESFSVGPEASGYGF